MRKLLAIVALFAAFSTLSVQAQVLGGNGIWKTVPIVVSGYTGPGDVVSGATAWYGLRAYNAAYATGSNNAVNVRRASDNSTQNIVILTTGALDIATANTFAGTDATASCTIATTVATCTGASSTPHTGSTITGSGILTPCYVTSVGTFTGGAGTVNLGGIGTSPCGTISVAATLTFQYGLYATEAYDQTGNANHVLQATAAYQPQLLPLCPTLPCINFASFQFMVTSGNVTLTSPWSGAYVGVRLAGFTTQITIIGEGTSPVMRYNAGANQVDLKSGADLRVNATDSVVHAVSWVSSATGNVDVDGTTTGGSSGTISGASVLNFGIYSSTIMETMEAGVWSNNTFSSGNQSTLCHQMYTYWATSTSC